MQLKTRASTTPPATPPRLLLTLCHSVLSMLHAVRAFHSLLGSAMHSHCFSSLVALQPRWDSASGPQPEQRCVSDHQGDERGRSYLLVFVSAALLALRHIGERAPHSLWSQRGPLVTCHNLYHVFSRCGYSLNQLNIDFCETDIRVDVWVSKS